MSLIQELKFSAISELILISAIFVLLFSTDVSHTEIKIDRRIF